MYSTLNGNIILDKAFDKIIIGAKYPFVICTLDGIDFVYNMNGLLASNQSFTNLSINDFRRSKAFEPHDILVKNSDTTKLKIANRNAFKEEIDKFREELTEATQGHDEKVRKLNSLFENGIEDPSTNLKIPKSDLKIYSNHYGNWVSVRNDIIHGLMDTDGNWIYPLEKRRIRLYEISLPYNGGTLEIIDGQFHFVINQDYKIIEQRPGKEIVKISDLLIDQIPEKYSVDNPQFKICSNIEEYVQVRDQKWTHYFNFKGEYIRSFRGITMEGFRYPANTDLRKFTFFINSKPIKYYARVTDGFVYTIDEIETM